MTVSVKTFGVARDICGSGLIIIDLPEAATVAHLRGALEMKYDDLKRLSAYAIAVNLAVAPNETVLSSSDELAIIPPVSGG